MSITINNYIERLLFMKKILTSIGVVSMVALTGAVVVVPTYNVANVSAAAETAAEKQAATEKALLAGLKAVFNATYKKADDSAGTEKTLYNVYSFDENTKTITVTENMGTEATVNKIKDVKDYASAFATNVEAKINDLGDTYKVSTIRFEGQDKRETTNMTVANAKTDLEAVFKTGLAAADLTPYNLNGKSVKVKLTAIKGSDSESKKDVDITIAFKSQAQEAYKASVAVREAIGQKTTIDIAGTTTLENDLTAAPVAGGGAVKYYSSDKKIATVNETTGVVTGVAAGKATITAKLTGNTKGVEAEATIDITVNPAKVTKFDGDKKDLLKEVTSNKDLSADTLHIDAMKDAKIATVNKLKKEDVLASYDIKLLDAQGKAVTDFKWVNIVLQLSDEHAKLAANGELQLWHLYKQPSTGSDAAEKLAIKYNKENKTIEFSTRAFSEFSLVKAAKSADNAAGTSAKDATTKAKDTAKLPNTGNSLNHMIAIVGLLAVTSVAVLARKK